MTRDFVIGLKGNVPPEGPPVPGRLFRFKVDPAPPGSVGEMALPLPEDKIMRFGLKDGDGAPPPGQKGLKDIIIKRKAVMMAPLDPKKMEEIKARADLMRDFEKAVESGDADSIRAVPPGILEDYREATGRMAKIMENIKKEMRKRDNQVRYAARRIDLSLAEGRGKDGSAVIRVWNDGPHIDGELLDTLFETCRAGRGGEFGLGRSIVKQILDFHQARVWVKNEYQGVAFYIRVQVSRGESGGGPGR